MEKLSSADSERLLAALPKLYAFCPAEDFPRRMAKIASRLVPCDHISYNEVDLRQGTMRAVAEPHDEIYDQLAPAFGQFMHQHPVIQHVAQTGSRAPLAISDFVPPSVFRRTGLYNEFFRPLGLMDQLSTTFISVPGVRLVALALNRGAAFTERERAMVETLRPHLAVAHLNSTRFSQALNSTGDPESLDRLARLTDRQYELLQLIGAGYTNAQAAEALGIRVGTVKKHVEHLLERLGVETRLGAASLLLKSNGGGSTTPWWTIDVSKPRAPHT